MLFIVVMTSPLGTFENILPGQSSLPGSLLNVTIGKQMFEFGIYDLVYSVIYLSILYGWLLFRPRTLHLGNLSHASRDTLQTQKLCVIEE